MHIRGLLEKCVEPYVTAALCSLNFMALHCRWLLLGDPGRRSDWYVCPNMLDEYAQSAMWIYAFEGKACHALMEGYDYPTSYFFTWRLICWCLTRYVWVAGH